MDGSCWVWFVASIHPFRTWMSGSFKSVQWNTCVHRLDIDLYSHPQEFWENRVRTHVNSKGKKIPSARGSEEGWSQDAAWCRTGSPTHYWLSYSGPLSRSFLPLFAVVDDELNHVHIIFNKSQIFVLFLFLLYYLNVIKIWKTKPSRKNEQLVTLE